MASVLKNLQPGDRVAAFSYGSGYGSELMLLDVGPNAVQAAGLLGAAAELAARQRISLAAYQELRTKGARAA